VNETLLRELIPAVAGATWPMDPPADPGSPFFRLSLESLKDALVASGRLSTDDVDAGSLALAEPGFRLITPQMVAAIGRRPPA